MARKIACSNCGEPSDITKMVTVTSDNKVLARICPVCQKAQKIQIVLARDDHGSWKYYQYNALEA